MKFISRFTLPCIVFFIFVSFVSAENVTSYSNPVSDTSQQIRSSYDRIAQTLGTNLSGNLTRVDLQTSNSSYLYYGTGVILLLYECDDATYGSPLLNGSGCKSIFTGLSPNPSLLGTSTQSFYITNVTFNPEKYYFFASLGNNMFNTIPKYYGSRADNVEGTCYHVTFTVVTPCETVSDLYFYFEGVKKLPPCCSNVLFLPGLEASRLYEQKTILGIPTEDQLWEPNVNSDVEALYLNPDGTSIGQGIYTKEIIKETNSPVYTGPFGQNIYKSFSEMMDSLAASGTIATWEAFPYDWRMSPEDIVSVPTKRENDQEFSLIGTLQSLVESSKSGSVTIVAHSNGGLVTKALLKKLQEDKLAGRNTLIDHIDTVILVAVPQLGTPTALPALLHGYDQDLGLGLLMTHSTARELGRNMQSGYSLLPSEEYFNRVSTPVISFVPNIFDPYTTNDIALYGENISTYSSQESFVTGEDGRDNPNFLDTLKPINITQSLLNRAENLHESIDTMELPEHIRVIQIAGWGISTISGFKYSAKKPCSYPTDNGCTGQYILDQEPIFTVDGDETVVTPSALAMEGEKYWVNLKNHNTVFKINREHKDIFEVSELDNFLKQIIINNEIVFDSIITNTQPVNVENHLQLSVHSPVTLDGYDIEENHTGKICPQDSGVCYVEENIPNSSYLEFGEGKYLNLPEEKLDNIKLVGTDIGTFTFESIKVEPNGQVTTSSFVDLPVTTQTQGEITLNTSNTPQLALDVTGDGIVDFDLSPNEAFDPIIFLEIMKTTVDSLELNKVKKTTFELRIQRIITLIQKGEIDQAKLKAENFTSVFERNLSRPDPKNPKPQQLSKEEAQLLLDMLNKLLDNLE
jgi:hypothetical protein